MRSFFSGIGGSIRDVVMAAVVDRGDVSEAKREWDSVQRFFRQAHQATEEKDLATLQLHLPDVQSRLDRIVGVLCEETRELLPPHYRATRPFFDYVFRPRGGSGDASTIFIHACQFAKIDQPSGSRALVLRFLGNLLAAADGYRMGSNGRPERDRVESISQEGEVLLDGENIAVPLMDVLQYCRRDVELAMKQTSFSPEGFSAFSAYIDVVALLCHFVHCRPGLERVLVPRGIANKGGDSSAPYLLLCVESALENIAIQQSPGLAAAALRGLISLAMIPASANDTKFESCVSEALQRWTERTLSWLASFFVTLCKLPDNPDSEKHALLCTCFLRFLDNIFVCTPHHAAAMKLTQHVQDQFLTKPVQALLRADDDRVFITASTMLSFSLRATVSNEMHSVIGQCLFEPGISGTLMRRCLDISDVVACASLTLLQNAILRNPDLALSALFHDYEEQPAKAPPLDPQTTGIDAEPLHTSSSDETAVHSVRQLCAGNLSSIFPSELSLRSVCQASPDDFVVSSQELLFQIESRRCILAMTASSASQAQAAILSAPARNVVEAPLIKMASERLRGVLTQPSTTNAAVMSLVQVLVGLPDVSVGATLLHEKGPLAVAFARVRAAVTQTLAATPELRQHYLHRCQRPVHVAVEVHDTTSNAEAFVAGCVALESFKHELEAMWRTRIAVNEPLVAPDNFSL